jgi:hypothetical protein
MSIFIFQTSHVFAENSIQVKKISLYELQWSLCESAESALQKLGIQSFQYQEKNQSYFDTENLNLLDKNVEFRIRELNGNYSGALKTSFISENSIPNDLVSDSNTGCEIDKTMASEKLGCKTKSKSDSIETILKEKQIQFIKYFFPEFNISQLKIYGPFLQEVWSTELSAQESFEIDSVTDKKGKKYFEISIRNTFAHPQIAFDQYSKLFLQKNIKICPTHVSRARSILTSAP